MEPADILKETKERIAEYAGHDPDKWFYANRFVFARLHLDERAMSTRAKKQLFDGGARCHRCGRDFETRKGVHIHRMDGTRGYSLENCALMHRECHELFHAEQGANPA